MGFISIMVFCNNIVITEYRIEVDQSFLGHH